MNGEILGTFSQRELEILRLLDEGLSDREIAQKLILTPGTVKWYNRQIYGKLGVSSRTQAIARAREVGLLDDDPAASHGVPGHNLPAHTTHFVGRKREIAEIRHLLQTTRLLTLTGSPGTGKTRLAQQVASEVLFEFGDGVYFIPLAPLTESALVVNAIAHSLEVIEVTSQPLLETLKQHLRHKQLLLILDNFEQILPGAPLLSELLAAAPDVKALVTSREALRLYGEQEYIVPPLALPDSGESLAELVECEAIALFVQRARAVNLAFDLTEDNALDVAKICVRLDGLPLPIELAAARVKMMTPQALVSRLSSPLETLTAGSRDLPPRQQTLRSTIAWSYNLLAENEKSLFARLAVFAGGWSLEAAEIVCAEKLSVTVVDGLASLMDKSLIQQTGADASEPRFTMLETIREYALERLKESEQEEVLRARHAAYFTAFAERTGSALYSRYRSAVLTHLETEQNNFRAALSWSLAGDPEPGLRLIAALGVCWRIRSYLVEGFNWAQRLLEKGTNVAPEVRANALSSASGLLACYLGNYADAERMSLEALDLAHKSGDPYSTASALYARGTSLMETHVAEARLYFDEALALFHTLDDQWGVAKTLNVIGEVTRLEGDDESAEPLYQQALTLFRQIGNPWGANIVLQNLAYIAQHRKDYERARALFTEGLINSRELQDKLSIANCLDGLAGILSVQGQPQRAARLFGATEVLRDISGAQIQPADRPDYESNLVTTRAQLDPAVFEAAWTEGRAMTLDQGVAYALEDSM